MSLEREVSMIARTSAILFLAASAFAGVDPVLLNLVMPDAKVLSGIQVDQSVASPFGQYLLSQMQSNDSGFLQFVAATGFDPTRDLTQMLAATGDTAANPNDVVLLGRGSFLVPQITAAVTANGGTVTPYGGFSVLTGPQAKSSVGAIVFLNTTTTAIGSLPAVEAAIDRWNAHATYAGSLATSAQTVSGANSAWFTTQTPLSDFLSGKLPGSASGLSQSTLFQSVTAASGGINFGVNSIVVTADALTTSPQNAQALVDVLKFLVSMVSTNNPSQPVTTLADAATFTANGATTHLSLSISEQQAEQLFMTSASPNARPARKKPAQ
jgi:hypothetical protein